MNKAYTIMLGASAMWMLAWGGIGAHDAARAHEADALYGEPLEFAPQVKESKKAERPWTRATITTYGDSYHGKPMNGGGYYDKNKMTVAVPVKGKTKAGRHLPAIPFGTMIEVRYKGRVVVVRVTDTCIGGTIDLSRAAMTQLLGRYEETKLKGEWRVSK